MALITKRCSARGATVIFTIDDVTLRATQIQWITVTAVMRIVVYDLSGNIALDINTGQTTSPLAVDLPVRLVQITRPDTSVKSYLSPVFAVFFGV